MTTKFDPNEALLNALCALFNDDRCGSVETLMELSANLNDDGLFPDTLSVCEGFTALAGLASLNDLKLIIPQCYRSNPYGIETGKYDQNGIVYMLRNLKNHPDAIQFIADMLEF